jgi:hypothetical protein
LKSKILFIVFLLFTISNANNKQFILLHDGLIDKRAQEKINQIGAEVKKRLDKNIYLHIIENNGIKLSLPRKERIKQMRLYDKQIISKLPSKNNYAVLVLSIDQMYANILLSSNLKNIIDKDDILDGYVIPLLASKDKNTLMAKVSASVLNGYAQIADSLAENKNIKLNSSIGSSGKTAGTIWRVFIYFLVVVGIVSYFFIILRQRKTKI